MAARTLLCLVFILSFSAVQANADVVIRAQEVGNRVVFNGGGSINLESTLGFEGDAFVAKTIGSRFNDPSNIAVGVSSTDLLNKHSYRIANIFGSGTSGTSQNLDMSEPGTAFLQTGPSFSFLFVDENYQSNAPITISASTEMNFSFATLGQAEGSFARIEWSNNGVTESIQINFRNNPIPEPTPLFVCGTALLAIIRRKRMA